MITRAISLLIIIGNRDTLEQDPNRKTVIDYIQKNQAVVQGGRKLYPRIEAP